MQRDVVATVSGRPLSLPTRCFKGPRGHARIAVLTFTPEEHAAAKVVFGKTKNIPMTDYYVSSPADPVHDIVLVEAERSNLPAEEMTGEVVRALQPTFILTCGTAGTKSDSGIHLGDLVVGEFIQYYEFAKVLQPRRKTAAWDVRPRPIAHDHPSHFLRHDIARAASLEVDSWLSRIRAEKPTGGGGAPRVHFGMILSGEKILSAYTAKEQDALLTRYDKALAVDTESYGVGRAIFRVRAQHPSFAWHYNPLFLPIRGITDIVDVESADRDRPAWTQYAAESACAFASDLANRLLKWVEM